MRIGVIDILADLSKPGLMARIVRKQYMSIMPQAISAWCRQLGHEVFYSTYYGQADLHSVLPDDLDVLFAASYTQASPLAYAISRAYQRRGTLTVIGGAHARAFPLDCQRFFDIVVHDCDKVLVDDILKKRVDSPAIVTSGRPSPDIPSVEERRPEIEKSSFYFGSPYRTSLIPMLSSVGCPYTCNFCVDWNNDYKPQSKDRLREDLEYVSRNWPNALIGFHDPNFAVRFDETLEVMEQIPEGRRNAYLMESSLSILKDSRLARVKDTNCIYIAPGIESWTDYSNKAGVGRAQGWNKLDKVVEHLDMLIHYGFGVQANMIFGIDSDAGSEPVEITKEFIRRTPDVWHVVNIPCPFGGTPLYDQLQKEDRVLTAMPFGLYYIPYLSIVPKHYDPLEYYNHLIDIYETMTSTTMLRRMIGGKANLVMKTSNIARLSGSRKTLALLKQIRDLLASDRQFRDFHLGQTAQLPKFYEITLKRLLGHHGELFSEHDYKPLHGGSGQPTRTFPAPQAVVAPTSR